MTGCNWTITGGIINSGVGINSVSVTWGVAGTQSISVNYINANGCTAASPTIYNVTVDPIPIVGTIDPATRNVCHDDDPGVITLTGYTTNILRWEYSTNAGRTWTTINNTSDIQIPLPNLSATYRVVLEGGQCGIAYSPTSIIVFIPEVIPTATSNPSPAVVCLGQTVTLTASSGNLDGPYFTGGDFNQANPAGWCVNDCLTVFPAQADNTDINIWSETNGPRILSGINYDTRDNTKFAIVNGAVTSTLETPVFSLFGITDPELTWWESYNLLAGTTTSIEISLDGGLTYYPEDVLRVITGPATFGVSLGLTFTSIDLTPYLGIKPGHPISYSGVMGSSWAMDDVMSQPLPNPVTYQWSPTTAMTPADGVGQTVTVSPTVTTDYTVTAILGGCPVGTSAPVTVTVNPLPVCSIVGPAGPVCPSSINNIYSAPPGMTRYEWSITGNGSITSGAGAQNVTVTAGTGCNSSFILTLSITDINGCVNTCTWETNVLDNTPPIITVPVTDLSMECFDASLVSAWAATASATDDCSGTRPVIPSYTVPINNCNQTVTVTFTSIDLCGNTSTGTSVFTVDDNTAPVITLL
jgi:hypothetical protein